MIQNHFVQAAYCCCQWPPVPGLLKLWRKKSVWRNGRITKKSCRGSCCVVSLSLLPALLVRPQRVIDEFQCSDCVVLAVDLFQPRFVDAFRGGVPKPFHLLDVVFGLPYGIAPLGEGVEVEVSPKLGFVELVHDFECHRGMDAPEHEAVFGRETGEAVVELDPEQFSFPSDHGDGLARVFARHEHVANVQGQAHVRSIDFFDQHQGRTGGGDGKKARVLVGGLVLQRKLDAGVGVAQFSKGVHQLVPLFVVVDLKRIIVAIKGAPHNHFVAAQFGGHFRGFLGQSNGFVSKFGIRVVHGPPREPRWIPQTDRPGHQPGLFQGFPGFSVRAPGRTKVLGIIEIDTCQSADRALAFHVIPGRCQCCRFVVVVPQVRSVFHAVQSRADQERKDGIAATGRTATGRTTTTHKGGATGVVLVGGGADAWQRTTTAALATSARENRPGSRFLPGCRRRSNLVLRRYRFQPLGDSLPVGGRRHRTLDPHGTRAGGARKSHGFFRCGFVLDEREGKGRPVAVPRTRLVHDLFSAGNRRLEARPVAVFFRQVGARGTHRDQNVSSTEPPLQVPGVPRNGGSSLVVVVVVSVIATVVEEDESPEEEEQEELVATGHVEKHSMNVNTSPPSKVTSKEAAPSGPPDVSAPHVAPLIRLIDHRWLPIIISAPSTARAKFEKITFAYHAFMPSRTVTAGPLDAVSHSTGWKVIGKTPVLAPVIASKAVT
mmetsp:Transcript_60096/g.122613  ORF Transcript_60096/g.122613 Transcript_60096/m.122613 type:complete len:715 (-) Transcript_60096:528-2672(-)